MSGQMSILWSQQGMNAKRKIVKHSSSSYKEHLTYGYDNFFFALISIDNGYDHLLHVCVHNKNVHVDKPTWEFLK